MLPTEISVSFSFEIFQANLKRRRCRKGIKMLIMKILFTEKVSLAEKLNIEGDLVLWRASLRVPWRKKVRDTPLKYLNIFQKATGLPFHFQSALSLCFA